MFSPLHTLIHFYYTTHCFVCIVVLKFVGQVEMQWTPILRDIYKLICWTFIFQMHTSICTLRKAWLKSSSWSRRAAFSWQKYNQNCSFPAFGRMPSERKKLFHIGDFLIGRWNHSRTLPWKCSPDLLPIFTNSIESFW